MSIFDPSTYVSPPAFVLMDASGTGHDQSCEALQGLDSPPQVRGFADGGFDLFCPHGCLDRIIARKGVQAVIEEAPSFTPGPKPSAEHVESRTWTREQVEEWLAGLGRKVEAHEVDAGLTAHAQVWLDAYSGDFAFLVDIKARGRRLTAGQAKGVLNCWRADLARRQRAERPAPKSTGLDLGPLPAGDYGVPGSDGRLKVRIEKPAKGKWAGWVFVKDAAEYGYGQRYGSQRPGGSYSGDIEDALQAILADPAEAMRLYGELTGTCVFCHRGLEDKPSVDRGYGPTCASKHGLPWG